MISVNLTGPYICCQAVIPQMKKIGKGKIINFGSIASFMGRPDRVGYVASKSGILGLTRALAIDLKGTISTLIQFAQASYLHRSIKNMLKIQLMVKNGEKKQ